MVLVFVFFFWGIKFVIFLLKKIDYLELGLKMLKMQNNNNNKKRKFKKLFFLRISVIIKKFFLITYSWKIKLM